MSFLNSFRKKVQKSEESSPTVKVTVKEIVKLKTDFVSLVEKPATGIAFIVTKEEESPDEIKVVTSPLKIYKSSGGDEKKLVYGVVYAPNTVDKQNEFASAEVIEDAAHNFMAKSRQIDVDHTYQNGAGFPVESYIASSDMEMNGETITKGSWVMVVEATDETWERVKKGELLGYSLAGEAWLVKKTVDVNPETMKIVEKSEKEKFSDILKSVCEFYEIKKDFSTELENVENCNLIFFANLLIDSFYDMYWNSDVNTSEEMKAEAVKSIEQFLEKVKSMSFVKKSETQEAENAVVNYVSKEELVKAKEEIKEIRDLIETSRKSIEEETGDALEEFAKQFSELKKSVNEIKSAMMKSSQSIPNDTVSKSKSTTEGTKYNLITKERY